MSAAESRLERDAPPVEGTRVERRSHAALAPYVRRVLGYSEWSPGPVTRHELPSSKVMLFLELGAPVRVAERDDGRPLRHHRGGLVAGLDDAVGLSQRSGFHAGIRLDLTPLGARKLFGMPASQLAGKIVGLSDAWPHAGLELVERLGELSDWQARLDLLQRVLVKCFEPTRGERDLVAWAVDKIDASGGKAEIAALVQELGYSHKHVVRLFHEQVGMTPKRYARLVRFEHLHKAIARGSARNMAEVAASLGYADQAHMVREVRHFAATTPTLLCARTR